LAASPEGAYLAARDKAIAEIKALEDSKSSESAIHPAEDKAIADLEKRLRDIVGPVAVTGFPPADRLNLALSQHDEEFGALTMARQDQAVECLTLVRSCWENMFLVHQLQRDGAGFVKTMRSHEAWGRISLGEWLLEGHVAPDSPFGKTTRDLIKRERLNAPKKMTVKGTAKNGIEKMYGYYAQLSEEAAHPSVTALERHFRRGGDGRWTLDISPRFKDRERLATLAIACNALLGVCLAVARCWAERRKTMLSVRSGSALRTKA
jgi:hypothetical protein